MDTSNSEATTKQVDVTMVLFLSILSFNKQVMDHTASNGKVIMATNNLPNDMVSNNEDVILEASAGLLDEGTFD